MRADASESLVTSLQLMMGVLIRFAALMISFIRGTPSVTFMEATPAKWNVFKVIWVPGSPIDWAPTAPTVDPWVMLALKQNVGGQKKSTWFNLCLDVLCPADVEKCYELFVCHFGLVIDNSFVRV